jgi:hypothetical protein
MTYEEKVARLVPGTTVYKVEIVEEDGRRVARVDEARLKATDTNGLFNLGGRTRMHASSVAKLYALSRRDAIDEYLEPVYEEVRELMGKIEPLLDDIKLVSELKGAKFALDFDPGEHPDAFKRER